LNREDAKNAKFHPQDGCSRIEILRAPLPSPAARPACLQLRQHAAPVAQAQVACASPPTGGLWLQGAFGSGPGDRLAPWR